jgi:hypothetical protein
VSQDAALTAVATEERILRRTGQAASCGWDDDHTLPRLVRGWAAERTFLLKEDWDCGPWLKQYHAKLSIAPEASEGLAKPYRMSVSFDQGCEAGTDQVWPLSTRLSVSAS